MNGMSMSSDEFVKDAEMARCQAFDKKFVATWMPTWRYHNTSHVGPPGNTAKFVVDPKKVYNKLQHSVMIS
ncbi:hypothetical protein ANCDUO_11445 [Ancylostoma duodenale]|uniref:Uncharacterized protein n=1 Tax=Ancylostoma duodenale TaxID=51022 RepID=A0A0C2CNT4_9BILA|nr:hypothetical protein ANCDUO_11445 [Ancylostoma duodenale]